MILFWCHLHAFVTSTNDSIQQNLTGNSRRDQMRDFVFGVLRKTSSTWFYFGVIYMHLSRQRTALFNKTWQETVAGTKWEILYSAFCVKLYQHDFILVSFTCICHVDERLYSTKLDRKQSQGPNERFCTGCIEINRTLAKIQRKIWRILWWQAKTVFYLQARSCKILIGLFSGKKTEQFRVIDCFVLDRFRPLFS